MCTSHEKRACTVMFGRTGTRRVSVPVPIRRLESRAAKCRPERHQRPNGRHRPTRWPDGGVAPHSGATIIHAYHSDTVQILRPAPYINAPYVPPHDRYSAKLPLPHALVFLFFASPAASGASRFLPLLAGLSASFLLAGFSAAFLLAGFSAAFLLSGLSAAFFEAGFSFSLSVSAFLDAGLSVAFLLAGLSALALVSAFFDAGLSAAFLLAGFSDADVSFLDVGLSAAFLDAGLSAAFFEAGLSLDEAPFLDAGFLVSFLSSSASLSLLLDPESPFLVSASFLPSLLGSGGPFLGSFLDPASFSYEPPCFSYSDDSLDAWGSAQSQRIVSPELGWMS